MNKIFKIKPIALLYMLLITLSINSGPLIAQSNLPSNNQSSYIPPSDNSNATMWGETKSNAFSNSSAESNSGSRYNAPALPDEPGASCVPVPEGTFLLLGFALIYIFIVLFKEKSKKYSKAK